MSYDFLLHSTVIVKKRCIHSSARDARDCPQLYRPSHPARMRVNFLLKQEWGKVSSERR